MILQALEAYYRRAELAPPGWEFKEIPFFVVVDESGHFVNLENRSDEGYRKGSPVLVPQAEIRSGTNAWKQPNLLWDHYGFVLGEQKRKPNGDLDPSDSPAKAARQLGSFRDRIETLVDRYPESPGLQALLAFYRSDEQAKVLQHPGAEELFKIPGANLTFVIQGQLEPIVHEPWVSRHIESMHGSEVQDADVSGLRRCLITGQNERIARLHPKVNGVCSKPAALSAANTGAIPAVSSYGKEQGFNFPVSESAAFAYTTALNHLLARGSRQRMQVGDTSTVFWAEEEHDLESAMPDIFGEPRKDAPDRHVAAVEALYSSVRSGKFAKGGPDTRFHVLGLAPNAARISIRFWETASALELGRRIQQHFDDIAIVHRSHEADYLSLFRQLKSVAVREKADDILPNLGGDVMRAILQGHPYPASLFNLAVQRCRAEQARKDQNGKPLPNVNHARAAIIKGCLNRLARRHTDHPEEYLPMLDPDNKNPAYRLGRLFATLERIQEDAAGGPGKLNATIRDRYYGAASSTPVAVFSTLLRLKNHHLGKLSRGRTTQMEKLVGEITAGLNDFPPHLHLADQGRFALGYYHQRQDFFTRKDNADNQEIAP